MNRPKRAIFSWRIKLAMILGGLAGLGLFLFSQYVATMDDSPNGRTPLSWTFKSNSASVATFFDVEPTMSNQRTPGGKPLPEIDRKIPRETEFALFALG